MKDPTKGSAQREAARDQAVGSATGAPDSSSEWKAVATKVIERKSLWGVSDKEEMWRIVGDKRMVSVFETLDRLAADFAKDNNKLANLAFNVRSSTLILMVEKGGARPTENVGAIIKKRKVIAKTIYKLIDALKGQDRIANTWLQEMPIVQQLESLGALFQAGKPIGLLDPINSAARGLFPRPGTTDATWLERKLIARLGPLTGEHSRPYEIVTRIVDVAVNRRAARETKAEFADRVAAASSRWRTYIDKESTRKVRTRSTS